MTASFVREWVRRTIVTQLSEGVAEPVLDEARLRATLEELTRQGHRLTGRLLGGT